MYKKTLPLILILVAALTLGACAPRAAAQQDSVSGQPVSRTISVTGKSMVYLDPDVAYITIGVHTENEDATAAVNENNDQAQQVVDALTAQGIDPKDIQTINFSIYPMQQYGPEGNLQGVRYAVDNSVYVTVRDLGRLGEIIGVATESGANSINGISFDVLDKDNALIEARRQAIDDARSMAEEMASAAGVSLGELVNISFTNSYHPIPLGMGRGGAMEAAVDSAVPISSGQLVLNAEVILVFEIQ